MTTKRCVTRKNDKKIYSLLLSVPLTVYILSRHKDIFHTVNCIFKRNERMRKDYRPKGESFDMRRQFAYMKYFKNKYEMRRWESYGIWFYVWGHSHKVNFWYKWNFNGIFSKNAYTMMYTILLVLSSKKIN